uniref:Uncharacterized protein n=1 Tax=Arundo donax TaxID=35708 RepID=A0A0A9GPL3_ARUDO
MMIMMNLKNMFQKGTSSYSVAWDSTRCNSIHWNKDEIKFNSIRFDLHAYWNKDEIKFNSIRFDLHASCNWQSTQVRCCSNFSKDTACR